VRPSAGVEVMEKKNLLLLPGFEPQLFGLSARSLVAIPTELSNILKNRSPYLTENTSFLLYKDQLVNAV
jgi:hypothetical protein